MDTFDKTYDCTVVSSGCYTGADIKVVHLCWCYVAAATGNFAVYGRACQKIIREFS